MIIKIQKTIILFILISLILWGCQDTPDNERIIEPDKGLATNIKTLPLTSTFTETPTSSTSPTITPTIDPIAKMVISPDGNYVAKLYYHPVGNKIIIQTKDGELLGEVSTHYTDPPGDPHPTLSIYKWSFDSKILYYYYPNYPDGGDYAFWWDGLDLHSYDVETGEITPVLPGKGQMAFAFSPDDTYIAYTRLQDNPFVLYILNLSDGSQKSVTIQKEGISYKRVGNIIWSPSGTDLAFQTEDQDYWIETQYLEVNKMEPKVIWEYDMGTFIAFEGWEEDMSLRFFDFYEDDVFTINVRDLLKHDLGTPTPKP